MRHEPQIIWVIMSRTGMYLMSYKYLREFWEDRVSDILEQFIDAIISALIAIHLLAGYQPGTCPSGMRILQNWEKRSDIFFITVKERVSTETR